MQKLKLNDEVVVLTGKDKGKTGKIKRINFNKGKVLVENVNVVKKAIRPTQQNPDGGLIDVEVPVHISNVAVISPKTKKATRVRIETKDGKRVRIAVSCGSVLV
ncbi:MAG: 50S ribosomal protein L24 [Halobacteriovoraceae bacterium]|nr:50S ribosomal protein L24 [Halobacteriovoraceae bacterium]